VGQKFSLVHSVGAVPGAQHTLRLSYVSGVQVPAREIYNLHVVPKLTKRGTVGLRSLPIHHHDVPLNNRAPEFGNIFATTKFLLGARRTIYSGLSIILVNFDFFLLMTVVFYR
jgi:hypothetical protein